MKRFERSLVDVGHIAVANGEPVDFQRISRLQCLLPSFVFYRGGVLGLLKKLTEVDSDLWIIDLKIAHEMTEEQRLPVNTGVQIRNIGDGGIRMRSLVQPQFAHVDRKADRMEIEFAEPNRITL